MGMSDRAKALGLTPKPASSPSSTSTPAERIASTVSSASAWRTLTGELEVGMLGVLFPKPTRRIAC
jgi:hypothetical protein